MANGDALAQPPDLRSLLGDCPPHVPTADWACWKAAGFKVDRAGLPQPIDLLVPLLIEDTAWHSVVTLRVPNGCVAAITAFGFEPLGGVITPWTARMQLNDQPLPGSDYTWWGEGIAGYIPGGITPLTINDIQSSPIALRGGHKLTLDAKTTTSPGTMAARLVGRLYQIDC